MEQYEIMRGPQIDAGVKVNNILYQNMEQYEIMIGPQTDADVKVNNILYQKWNSMRS